MSCRSDCTAFTSNPESMRAFPADAISTSTSVAGAALGTGRLTSSTGSARRGRASRSRSTPASTSTARAIRTEPLGIASVELAGGVGGRWAGALAGIPGDARSVSAVEGDVEYTDDAAELAVDSVGMLGTPDPGLPPGDASPGLALSLPPAVEPDGSAGCWAGVVGACCAVVGGAASAGVNTWARHPTMLAGTTMLARTTMLPRSNAAAARGKQTATSHRPGRMVGTIGTNRQQVALRGRGCQAVRPP